MMRIDILLILIFLPFYASCQESIRAVPAFPSLSQYQNLRDLTMSASGTEAYFTVQSPMGEVSVLARRSKTRGQWNEVELLPFSGRYKDLEPALSPDGLRLYFVSNRPLNGSSTETKDFDIWFVERQGMETPWGKPVNLGDPVNTEHNEFFPSVAENNNLYFTSDRPDSKGKDDIFFSAWQGETYGDPVSLDSSVNTEGYEFNAFVAPDESFLIFSGYNRTDGLGSGDLYISYKSVENGWSKAVNLGEKINSGAMDYCPYVDTGSNTLFFTSKRSALGSVQDFRSMQEVLDKIGQYENGLSRIYKLPFDASLYIPKQE